MKISLFGIFKIFCLIGIQLLGGGYVILPLLKKYLVEERNWLSENELIDYFAMSQCIPGIIAGNISVCCGYKLRKIWGALMAILGIITPSFIAIIIIANIINSILNCEIIQNAFWGIRISVIVLVLITVRDMWNNSVNSGFTYFIYFVSLGLLLLLPVSPALIIIISAVSALLYSKFRGRDNA